MHPPRDLLSLRRLHSLITKYGTPKVIGAHPRLYAKQRPGPPGATRGTPFPPLDFCLPILLRTASCVSEGTFGSWLPIRPRGFANSRTPPTDRTSSPGQHCVLPKHKCGTCIRVAASVLGTADGQKLGAHLRSLWPSAGHIQERNIRHTRATTVRPPSSPSTSTNALPSTEVNLHLLRRGPLSDLDHLCDPVTRHITPTRREPTDGSPQVVFYCFGISL